MLTVFPGGFPWEIKSESFYIPVANTISFLFLRVPFCLRRKSESAIVNFSSFLTFVVVGVGKDAASANDRYVSASYHPSIRALSCYQYQFRRQKRRSSPPYCWPGAMCHRPAPCMQVDLAFILENWLGFVYYNSPMWCITDMEHLNSLFWARLL